MKMQASDIAIISPSGVDLGTLGTYVLLQPQFNEDATEHIAVPLDAIKDLVCEPSELDPATQVCD
jgi:hypothetical protein